MKKYSAAWKKQDRPFFMVWRSAMGDMYEFTTLSATPGFKSSMGRASCPPLSENAMRWT